MALALLFLALGLAFALSGGGSGRGTLDGGKGADHREGVYGNDTVLGSAGNDAIHASDGDLITTGSGADTVRASVNLDDVPIDEPPYGAPLRVTDHTPGTETLRIIGVCTTFEPPAMPLTQIPDADAGIVTLLVNGIPARQTDSGTEIDLSRVIPSLRQGL